MTPTTRDELHQAIVELHTVFPDWRFGQLIANLATAAGVEGAGAIWDMEDERLLAAARRLIERNEARMAVQTVGKKH